MFLMDRFFDGTFLTFGIEVISFAERDQEDRIDPMVSLALSWVEFSSCYRSGKYQGLGLAYLRL